VLPSSGRIWNLDYDVANYSPWSMTSQVAPLNCTSGAKSAIADSLVLVEIFVTFWVIFSLVGLLEPRITEDDQIKAQCICEY